MSSKEWSNGRLWGWIDITDDGVEILTLSAHSQLDLARENNERTSK